MKVLVTGASGFIGQALVPRLASRGHEVRALARHAEGVAARPHVEPFRGDLLDPASLERAAEGMDAIVHLACATGIAHNAQVRRVNVDGTRALLDAAQRHNVRRFVFVSTISATRERMGPYGRTKKEGEAMVAHAGLEWITVRPSLVYGSAPVGLFTTLAGYLSVIGERRAALKAALMGAGVVCALEASQLAIGSRNPSRTRRMVAARPNDFPKTVNRRPFRGLTHPARNRGQPPPWFI
jgi:uncharacterized protein YbjT (DUF2867 family)